MKYLLASLLFLAAALSAADLTGTWTGTFTTLGPDGEEKAATAHLNLKQNGTELTGTAGPNENEQWEISKGKVEGDRITFEVQRPNEGAVYRFDLRLVNDRIQGDVTAEKDGDTRKAKLDVTRKTAPSAGTLTPGRGQARPAIAWSARPKLAHRHH